MTALPCAAAVPCQQKERTVTHCAWVDRRVPHTGRDRWMGVPGSESFAAAAAAAEMKLSSLALMVGLRPSICGVSWTGGSSLTMRRLSCTRWSEGLVGGLVGEAALRGFARGKRELQRVVSGCRYAACWPVGRGNASRASNTACRSAVLCACHPEPCNKRPHNLTKQRAGVGYIQAIHGMSEI